MHIAAPPSIRMSVLCRSERCRHSNDMFIMASPQARVVGAISGGLPSGLQRDVLGALTAFLKLCPDSSPFLVLQLEFLVALLPQGLLTARLTGSRGAARLKPSREAFTASGAGLPYAAVPSPARTAERPPGAGALEQPCHSELWCLLTLGGPGEAAAVRDFAKELIRVLLFAADCVLDPPGTLLQFRDFFDKKDKVYLQASRSALVVGSLPPPAPPPPPFLRPLLPARRNHC